MKVVKEYVVSVKDGEEEARDKYSASFLHICKEWQVAGT